MKRAKTGVHRHIERSEVADCVLDWCGVVMVCGDIDSSDVRLDDEAKSLAAQAAKY